MTVYSDSEIKCGYPLMNVQQVEDKVQPTASYAIFFTKKSYEMLLISETVESIIAVVKRYCCM